ncbi:MAG: hypothetical protein WC522_04830 [Candidatus Omnitrophota bacterium]
MKLLNILVLLFTIFAAAILSSCSSSKDGRVDIVDAKIVTAIDEKLMPMKVTDTFPAGTTKICCWIKWKNARINTQIISKWHYVTDDVHIDNYIFTIPKKEGMGSVTLTIPPGKNLPVGLYRVDLLVGKRLLESLTFRVE